MQRRTALPSRPRGDPRRDGGPPTSGTIDAEAEVDEVAAAGEGRDVDQAEVVARDEGLAADAVAPLAPLDERRAERVRGEQERRQRRGQGAARPLTEPAGAALAADAERSAGVDVAREQDHLARRASRLPVEQPLE